MKHTDEQLDLLAKRYRALKMKDLLCITFGQYAALPAYYDAKIMHVTQRTHGLNITNGLSRLVPLKQAGKAA
ncbi:hypothetical protein [uncultured Desulfuromonas sp.]|uniref:hypothetical protein n=1 Tax=uncultured Desulfuromonas sp. TaxID=181013 RepID=UPI002AABB187|nr:hypothetical protein [uncultured Desulfuromonas sp.]